MPFSKALVPPTHDGSPSAFVFASDQLRSRVINEEVRWQEISQMVWNYPLHGEEGGVEGERKGSKQMATALRSLAMPASYVIS